MTGVNFREGFRQLPRLSETTHVYMRVSGDGEAGAESTTGILACLLSSPRT